MTLDMLNVMLAVSEEGMIEEMLLALLASPQLAVFFEKFPRLKNIIAADIPRWREAVRARLKEVNIPPDLDAEVQTYQQAQLLSTSQFIVQLPQILGKLHQLQSPFAAQAQKLVDDNATFTPALHTLFLQRWRLKPATVPEQVDGLQQSDDILRLLPPELATLGITELEFEFYRKLVEKQLLTYRLHGDAWREKITERPVTRQDFDEQPRGPFIVCVDTSGSMGGFNEQCAKAFCLALMRIALADNRRCFIMLFSSEVVHYELTSESGLEQAIRFLSQRFRGGTDLASCFRAIIERLQNPQWVDADAVVISDFIAQRLPDEVIAQVGELQRKHQHRFHAVAMSVHGKPGIMRIFDHIWRFDTGLRSRLLRRWRR